MEGGGIRGGGIAIRLDVGMPQDADVAELDDATLNLRRELLQLDVDRVDRATGGPPPPGARSAEVAVVGTLLVSAGQELVSAVIHTALDFVRRGFNRRVTIEIGGERLELTGASSDQQQRLVDAFLERHSSPV